MTMEVKIIKTTEILGKVFTIYGTAETPLFKATDVAAMLELTNVSDMISRVDEEERTKLNLGRQGECNMLTEDGLYEVLMLSRKPIAKQFKKGVKAILKEIRRNGGYIAASQDESDEEIMAKALVVAQATINRKNKQIHELEAENADQKMVIAEKNTEIESYKLRQSYLDVVLQCKSTVKVTVIAQDYGMSAKAFNKVLNELGIQHRVGKQWILYAKYLKEGYVQSKPFDIKHNNGLTDVCFYTEWTQKGRMFLYNTLKSNGVLPLIER